MSITSGLTPVRRYADGGSSFFNTFDKGELQRQNRLISERAKNRTPEETQAAFEALTPEEKARISDPYSFKEYGFDYTDPYEYATLPLYAAGPIGAAANKGIKAARIANKASKAGKKYKPSGIENILGSKSVAYGVPAATLAGQVGYELATEEEELEDDALDQATEDLDVVNANEKKDKSDPFFTQNEDGTFTSTESKLGKDKKLTKKEKGIMAMFAALESLGDSGSQSSSTPGYMIEGMGAATPEITRYEGGGIANIDPMMMAGGGIAKFAVGKEVVKKTAKAAIKKGKEGIEKLKKYKDGKAKAKAKADAKETGVTKDKPVDPRDSYIPEPLQPLLSGAAAIGKKVFSPSKYSSDTKQQIGAGLTSLIPAVVGATALTAYADRGKDEETPEAKTERLAKEAQDKLDAEYKERQEAREGLTSVADIHYARSLERAQEAGRTKPTFMDYLASFPASYGEKMSKDPEFAQQMMAGFAAMGKTTEGYVTRNAFTDFTQGAQEERIRQDEGTPDQLKMMQMLAAKPELADAYRKFNASTTPSDPTADLTQALSIEQAILSILYDGDPGRNDKVYDKAGNVVDKTVLLQLYREADGDYTEILKQVSKKSS